MHGMNVRENTVSIHTGIHMYTVCSYRKDICLGNSLKSNRHQYFPDSQQGLNIFSYTYMHYVCRYLYFCTVILTNIDKKL